MNVFTRPAQPAIDSAELVVSRITVAGPREPFVADVSFVAPAREVTVLPVDPGYPQAALALALAGRMQGVTGTVAVAGHRDRRVLQSVVRLVDVEDVSAPDDALPLRTVIGEELALADQSASRVEVQAYLAQRDLASHATDRWDQIPVATRVALLTELGSWRPGTRVLVLAGPDRHGGDPLAWKRSAERIAARGLTVVVLCAPATVAQLTARQPTARQPTAQDLVGRPHLVSTEDVHA